MSTQQPAMQIPAQLVKELRERTGAGFSDCRAALDPRYVRREEVTPEMLEKERDIYKAQALATGKPENVVEKIVNGKMEKFYEENCLYEQHYIKDESVTIGEMITQAIAKLGENVAVRRFVRFKVGEVASAGPETGAGEAGVAVTV